MAINVAFTQRDLSRGIIVDPSWYLVKIDSVTPKESKDGKSMNYIMEGTVIRNADDGNDKFAGAVITWNFNSKAPGFMQGLFKALIGPDATLVAGERYDLEGTVEKEVDMFIANGEYLGKLKNEVPHRYRYPKHLTE